jgi:hypothetical protein
MKKDLLEILNKELNGSKVKDDVIKLSENLIDFYESNRAKSTDKFKRFLNKYNFETISTFSEYPEYPQITLFHGSGGLEFWPVIDYEGGVTDRDESIGTIVKEPPYDKSEYWLNDDNYEGEIKDEIIEWNWEIHRRVVFVWLCTIWQEIKGYEYGIVVKTLENNSVRQFIFNDLSWDNLSIYASYNDKTKRLKRHFENDLSIREINQNIKKRR